MPRSLSAVDVSFVCSGHDGYRPIAVEYFLQDLDTTMPKQFYIDRLREDSASCGWNAQTVDAIRAGIKLAYSD